MNVLATFVTLNFPRQLKSCLLFMICVTGVSFALPPELNGQTNRPEIELQELVIPEAQDVVKLAFKIKNASDKRVRIRLTTEVDGVSSKELSLPEEDDHVLVIRLLRGDNTISIIGFVNDVPKELAVSCAARIRSTCPSKIVVKCDTRWCKDSFSLSPDTVIVEPKDKDSEKAGSESETAAAKKASDKDNPKSSITITSPQGDGPIRYRDVGEVPMEIRVAQKPDKKDNIKNVSILVKNAETGVVNQDPSTLTPPYPSNSSDPAVLDPKVRVGKGRNEITVFDPKNAKSDTASLNIICEGPSCGELTFADASVDRFSSIYTRGIVGFEQSGGSAAESVQKPFLEFFWNPPIATSEEQKAPFRYIYPRASLWGSVKLTSVPQQVSTQLATFAPSFLAPINEGKVNELVQGFDFLVGFEAGFGRGLSRGDIGTAFLPTGVADTKQKFSAYFIAGIGAISPLSPKDTVQIFKRPSDADLEKLGLGALDPKFEFIAFASPDRDSFFRQYYAGVRIKTHYFKLNSLGKYDVVNRPGGMFDVTLGQNEAVTGGRLRGLVVRFDGFYPLPVSNRSILYLYGTAMINVRKRPAITDPVFLATAPSDTAFPAGNVFVTTSAPSNRDLYRIGIGVNFLELFRGGFTQKSNEK